MVVTVSLGDIFIGSAIEEWSERRVLQHVHAALVEAGEPFVILASFHLSGRQVDSIVVTERRVLVIEAKVSRLPVRGQMNGEWERLHPSGQWRQYRNAYVQALRQKNLLLDAMRKRGETGSFYPDAAVVFAAPLPKDSALTPGDFKVGVIDLEALDPGGAGASANPWPLAAWREFAASLGMRPVGFDEAVADATLEPEYALLRDYRSRVADQLERGGRGWLVEREGDRDLLADAAEEQAGCYIAGPSGCGKTLAAQWLGARLARAGDCVIFAAAKDYDGSWSRLLRRELALVSRAKTRELLKAAEATGCPIRIVLDGINELGASAEAALRGLRAIARRFDARVIVTGQADPPEQLLGLARIDVAPPTLALKERIAGGASGIIEAGTLALLKAVTSGFEAAIVGEVGANVKAGASRQLLVDQFIRKRLAGSARAGALGLRRFAEKLISTTTFSASETGFDELMVASGVPLGTVDAAFAAGLLVRRGGRVSFAHEILLNACAAYAFADHATEAAEKFAILLGLPVLDRLAADIVSVIENASSVRTILAATSHEGLLFEAATGLAGPTAAMVAGELLEVTVAALEGEIVQLELAIEPGEKPMVKWADESLRAWSDPELARIGTLARMIGTGRMLDRHFGLCAAMDARLFEERVRLADAAKAAGIGALKSMAFELAYYGLARESGFARVSRSAASGVFDIADLSRRSGLRDMMALTSGQLHFYLERRRLFLDHMTDDEVADGLTRVMSERFRFEPYHVKLAILHAATFVRGASDEKVQALVSAIEAVDANRESIWISTSIVDALKFLGALEDSAEGARDSIIREFEQALVEDEDDEVRRLALVTSTTMFDHPFDHIYGEVFEALPEEQRRLLLRRAARATEARQSANLNWVLREVAGFADLADAAIMQEFSTLPDPRNSFPQEEWGAFAAATQFLGKHGLPLPPLVGDRDAEKALILLRSLLYALEANSATQPAGPIWDALDALPAQAVMGTLCELEATLREQYWEARQGTVQASLVKSFRSETLRTARRFLDGGEEAAPFRRAQGRDEARDLAFSIIETFGDRSDIARLRRLADLPRHARRAVEALRKLDSA